MTTPINPLTGDFPFYRPRRLRQHPAVRGLVRETRLSAGQLVMPLFVREGTGAREAIESMPGQFRHPVDTLCDEIEELRAAGVHAVLLFGIPDAKDLRASSAWSPEGIVQRAVRKIKQRFKDVAVITDVCLCAYMSHGHCGVIDGRGQVDNDTSLKLLADTAVSHAAAGADIVAPSDMMDGRVAVIRHLLDEKGFKDVGIMSYAAKYASAFYGPFRDAAHSAPKAPGTEADLSSPHALGGDPDRGFPTKAFGNDTSSEVQIPKDRKSYQMDPANLEEALREIALDIKEGADIVMVKPALPYMDVIREAARNFSYPLAAYAVSGEYAMIKAAAEKGWLNEKDAVMEMMTGLCRAGARILITYHARAIAQWLAEEASSAAPIRESIQP